MGEARDRALYRAVHEYGDHLRIEPAKRTVTTLQGQTETGWIVWGRAYSGDDLGCVFPNRTSAQIAIAKAKKGEQE
jgi:hypothetical protein